MDILNYILLTKITAKNIMDILNYILLTKITAMQNEVAASYHRVHTALAIYN